MGSMARPVVRHLWILVQAGTDAVSHELAHHGEAVGLRVPLHRVADVAHPVARLAHPDPGEERLLGHAHELRGLLSDPAHGHRARGVAVEAPHDAAEVEPDDIALLQAPRPGDAVHDLLVDGDAERGRVSPVAQERGARARLLDAVARDAVHLARGHAGLRGLGQHAQGVHHDRAGAVHLLQLGP
jgi:hypothetical protein